MSHILATGLQIKTEMEQEMEMGMELKIETEMEIEKGGHREQANLIRNSFIPEIVFNCLNDFIFRYIEDFLMPSLVWQQQCKTIDKAS